MNQQATIETNDLTTIEQLTPADLFREGGLDPILQAVAQDARSLVPDMSTAKGRKAIASNAYRVAQTKTLIDGKGKEFVADMKAKVKAVDQERKRARDFLDNLRDEVRQPLNEYEEAEKRRQETIAWMREVGSNAASNWITSTYEELSDQRDQIRAMELKEAEWGDDFLEAVQARNSALEGLVAAIEARARYDAEQAELARLRQIEQERQEEERRQQAIDEAAERKVQAAAEAEHQRKQQEPDREYTTVAGTKVYEKTIPCPDENPESKNQPFNDMIAEKEHKACVNREALKAFRDNGLTDREAVKIITLIARGQIPHITINY